MRPEVERARLLLDSGRAQAALDQLRQSPALVDDPTAVWLLGRCHLELGDARAAQEQGERTVGLAPGFSGGWSLLARALEEQDDLAGAERALLSGLAADPDEPALLHAYSRICGVAGQLPKARELAALGQAAFPDDADFVVLQAHLAWLEGRDRRAEALAKEALALDPEHRPAHVLLGDIYQIGGRAAAADERLRTAVLADPTDHAVAELAREVRVQRHWTMLPFRVARQLGGTPTVFILCIGGAVLAGELGWDRLGLAFTATWVLLAIWSWIAPHIARKAALG